MDSKKEDYSDARYIIHATFVVTDQPTSVTLYPNKLDAVYEKAREMRRLDLETKTSKYRAVWILDTKTGKKIWDGLEQY